MRKLFEILRLTALSAVMLNASFVLTGCDRNGDDGIEDAADDVGDALEDAGDEIEDAVD